jgi:hypothetical protein
MAARVEGFAIIRIVNTPSLVWVGCTTVMSMVIGLIVSSVQMGRTLRRWKNNEAGS